MSMPMSAPRLDHHHARITEDWALRQLGIPLYELELEGETIRCEDIGRRAHNTHTLCKKLASARCWWYVDWRQVWQICPGHH